MNIYVGNLAYSVTEDDLRSAFSEFGSVTSVNVITDKFSGQSKGFGFVEMANSEHADQAISELNGHSMDGRQLNVNEARERSGGAAAPAPFALGGGAGPAAPRA